MRPTDVRLNASSYPWKISARRRRAGWTAAFTVSSLIWLALIWAIEELLDILLGSL